MQKKLTEQEEKNQQRILNLMHAMQSGVAMKMSVPQADPRETSLKHLRVGVNAALIQIGALTATLIELGVVNYELYQRKEIELLEAEVNSYEAELSNLYKTQIKLH
jgi:hypothetical protein